MRIAPLFVVGAMLVVMAPTEAPGQAPLRGVVVDSMDRPLSGVEVVVERTGRLTRTLADGTFRIDSLSVGPVLVLYRLVGYTPVQTTHDVAPGMAPVHVTLAAAVQELPEARVEAPPPWPCPRKCAASTSAWNWGSATSSPTAC